MKIKKLKIKKNKNKFTLFHLEQYHSKMNY